MYGYVYYTFGSSNLWKQEFTNYYRAHKIIQAVLCYQAAKIRKVEILTKEEFDVRESNRFR